MAAAGRELLDPPDQPSKPSFWTESLLVGIDKSWKQGGEDGKAKTGPLTTPVPSSQVLGKVKDFLGVMAKANEKLELEAENSRANYDIEVLSENEQQYIEMDLLLGVADLHTPEAVAAAEANMSGFGPSITSTKRISADTEDDSDEDVDNTTCPTDKFEKSDSVKNDSSRNNKPNKQPKIVVLD